MSVFLAVWTEVRLVRLAKVATWLRWLGLAGVLALLIGVAGLYISPLLAQPTSTPELRGVWVQSRSIITPDKLLATINRAEVARFNAIFVEVMVGKGAFYDSSLIKKHPTVATDFDPLARLISEAHQRGIQVHAWFPVGYLILNDPTLPTDWATINVDDTARPRWINFVHPEARRWLTSLILEAVTKYDLDGVHLDTIRYPEVSVSFDSYSLQTMTAEYQVDLELLRGSALPAYGYFRGNPLVKIGTAQVLAEFENGVPAVLLNKYQQGQVIVLNWMVGDRPVAASSQILARSVRYLAQEESSTYLLENKSASQNIQAILTDVGIAAHTIRVTGIARLEDKDVLILPNVYQISDEMSDLLRVFVARGGSLIFIDGPVPSIQNPNIQLLTGMVGSGSYFDQAMQLQAIGSHPIIPISSEINPVDYQSLFAKWTEFRMKGVNAFVQEVYQAVKTVKPQAKVSAAVKSDQDTAQRTMQDWPTWVKNGYIDTVIPMAYKRDTLHLQQDLLEWRLITANNITSIVPGLSVDFESSYPVQPKPVAQVFDEVALSRHNGYRGYVLFDLEHVSDELLNALATSDVE